eukprot:COSAG01_NODE_13601_length_1561_cov_1.034884_3_plen_181_part_01
MSRQFLLINTAAHPACRGCQPTASGGGTPGGPTEHLPLQEQPTARRRRHTACTAAIPAEEWRQGRAAAAAAAVDAAAGRCTGGVSRRADRQLRRVRQRGRVVPSINISNISISGSLWPSHASVHPVHEAAHLKVRSGSLTLDSVHVQVSGGRRSSPSCVEGWAVSRAFPSWNRSILTEIHL